LQRKNKTYFSDSFVEFIVKSSGGFLSSSELDKLFNSFQNEAEKYNFNVSAENNLRRIIESSFDKITFIREALYYSHHTEILFALVCSGNYLTDIVVRNPEYLHQLFDARYLSAVVQEKSIRKELTALSSRYKKFETVVKMLKLYKRRMILKIGLNDILGNHTLEETVAQLSALAKETLSFLFQFIYERTLEKYQIGSTNHSYALASLGKLGGNELNYSSDTDLILFFNKHGKTGKAKKDYFELLNETAQKFIQTASEPTGEGYLYRIDFRLRPDGKNSPLAKTLTDYISYYETRAEEWERQMLIKLNFLGGSQKLFDKFKNFTEHFVYPLSLKSSPQAEIGKMKRNIERKLSDESNVKLFSGGIRDVEFSVQALQLLNGGRIPQLRSGNTIDAIKALKAFNLLSDRESNIFTNAYKFYRKIEHYRQLLNDTQTHDLPEDGEQLKSLSIYLGFNDVDNFLSALSEHRKNVRAIFESIVGAEVTKEENQFDKINFTNKPKAKKNLAFLRSGIDLSGVKKFDRRTSKKFEAIEPTLFEFLLNARFPDIALDNFTKVIGASPKAEFWFNEFANKDFFNTILKLFCISQKVVETLLAAPQLGETLITRKAFISNFENEFENTNVTELRFILSVQFSLKLINHSQLSQILSKFIDYKIQTLSKNLSGKYFIAAMGSYGAREMGLESDIDLIFAVDKISDNEKTQKEFQTFLDDLKTELFPFEIDCRLRPEGNRSPLAVEVKRYEEYFANRARIWEFQSFLKFRFVCGNERLFEKTRNSFFGELTQLNVTEAKKEALAMRKKLIAHPAFGAPALNVKKSSGAALDIEFIIFFAVLQLGKKAVKLNKQGTTEKISLLFEANIFDKQTSETLSESFSFFKTIEFALQNLFSLRTPTLPNDIVKLSELAEFFEFESTLDFKNTVSQNTQAVKNIFAIFT